MQKEVKKVAIEIKSRTNEDENVLETTGEYTCDEQTHLLTYTDYTGNVITRNGFQIGQNSILLHRTGGIVSDMLFDLNNDTVAKYSAFLLETTFIIHTTVYKVYELKDSLWVHLEYSLNNTEHDSEIKCVQDIYVFFKN